MGWQMVISHICTTTEKSMFLTAKRLMKWFCVFAPIKHSKRSMLEPQRLPLHGIMRADCLLGHETGEREKKKNHQQPTESSSRRDYARQREHREGKRKRERDRDRAGEKKSIRSLLRNYFSAERNLGGQQQITSIHTHTKWSTSKNVFSGCHDQTASSSFAALFIFIIIQHNVWQLIDGAFVPLFTFSLVFEMKFSWFRHSQIDYLIKFSKQKKKQICCPKCYDRFKC